MWGHLTSFPVMWLTLPVIYSTVKGDAHPKHKFLAFYSPFCHFRSNDFISGSRPVTWGHLISFPVMWLTPAASCRTVGGNACPKASFRPCTASSRSLLFKWLHFGVTSGHVTSVLVMWLPPPASYSPVGAERHPNSSFRPSTATSRLSLEKGRHFQVSYGHVRSCDVIFCHVTAICEFQTSRSWNKPKTQDLAFCSHFQVTSGQMTTLPYCFCSLPVTWHHFLSLTATSCEV